MRHCGQCTLCCKLVPVKELDKPAGKRCEHQRMGNGCKIYADRPFSCVMWSCKWYLSAPGTERLSRPDFSHYVIDMMPDYVIAQNEDTGVSQEIPVIQIWCDPRHPEAWRDPKLLEYIDNFGGYGAIIRYDNAKAKVIFPPSMTGIGWVENDTAIGTNKEHTAAQIMGVLNDL